MTRKELINAISKEQSAMQKAYNNLDKKGKTTRQRYVKEYAKTMGAYKSGKLKKGLTGKSKEELSKLYTLITKSNEKWEKARVKGSKEYIKEYLGLDKLSEKEFNDITKLYNDLSDIIVNKKYGSDQVIALVDMYSHDNLPLKDIIQQATEIPGVNKEDVADIVQNVASMYVGNLKVDSSKIKKITNDTNRRRLLNSVELYSKMSNNTEMWDKLKEELNIR